MQHLHFDWMSVYCIICNRIVPGGEFEALFITANSTQNENKKTAYLLFILWNGGGGEMSPYFPQALLALTIR